MATWRLGRYDIIEERGSGGMGILYRAYDPALGAYVAVKVLAPELARRDDAVQRFLREARAASSVRHPHVVTVYDVGVENGLYYIAMEYIQGPSLRELLRQRGVFSLEEVVTIARQIAAALDHIHAQGLVHRDVKPGNILMEPTGRAVLTDFGLVRSAWDSGLTGGGQLLGTLESMAPEQAQGQQAGPAADQYGLGVVIYELLAGRPPFQAEVPAAVIYQVVHEPPPPLRRLRPDLPPAVDGVVSRALAKDPARRYPSALAFAAALAAAAGRPAPPVRTAPTPGRWPSWALALLVGVVLVGVTAGVILLAALPDPGRGGAPSPRPTPAPSATPGSGAAGPAGRLACVGDGGRALAVVEVEMVGGRPRVQAATVRSLGVVGSRHPTWSPDGDWLILQVGDGEEAALWSVPWRGTGFGDAAPLTSAVGGPPLAGRYPAWSPDGRSLAYVASSALWRCELELDGADLACRGPVQLAELCVRAENRICEDRYPAWSPDGQTIAFTRIGNDDNLAGINVWDGRDRGEIYTVPSSGGTPTNQTNSPESWDAFPAWAPGGELAWATAYGSGFTTRTARAGPWPDTGVEPAWGPAGWIGFTFYMDWDTVDERELRFVQSATGEVLCADGTPPVDGACSPWRCQEPDWWWDAR